MPRSILSLLPVLAFSLLGPSLAARADTWEEGTHYYRVPAAGAVPAAATPAPAGGTVTVTEVFSYGCPACNAFVPYMRALQSRLGAGVQYAYVPASWIAAEDWPVLQRAYLAARELGVAEAHHEAMFDAIWQSGELATYDRAHRAPASPLPTLEDVARFYERVAGVPQAKFLATARSPAVDTAVKAADEQVKAWQAERTPTLIINGKYRVDPTSAGGAARMVELANWLVERERAGQ